MTKKKYLKHFKCFATTQQVFWFYIITVDRYSQFPFDELRESVVLHAVLAQGSGFHVQVVEQYVRLIAAPLVLLLPSHRVFESVHKVNLWRNGADFFEIFADGRRCIGKRAVFTLVRHVSLHELFPDYNKIILTRKTENCSKNLNVFRATIMATGSGVFNGRL